MRSYILDFFRLRQNFKQVVIRQEVESSEHCPLRFQVISKTTLDNFKVLVCLFESLFETLSGASIQCVWLLFGSGNASSPNLINFLELLVLRWQLSNDIRRVENWLEVHP